MRNPKLVPYETIVRATSGEPEDKAIRILPSKNMEGFFVSKFIKGE